MGHPQVVPDKLQEFPGVIVQVQPLKEVVDLFILRQVEVRGYDIRPGNPGISVFFNSLYIQAELCYLNRPVIQINTVKIVFNYKTRDFFFIVSLFQIHLVKQVKGIEQKVPASNRRVQYLYFFNRLDFPLRFFRGICNIMIFFQAAFRMHFHPELSQGVIQNELNDPARRVYLRSQGYPLVLYLFTTCFETFTLFAVVIFIHPAHNIVGFPIVLFDPVKFLNDRIQIKDIGQHVVEIIGGIELNVFG